MKFAFVSHILPPSWSGQAVVIYRLLKELNPNDYCLISRESYDDLSASKDESTGRLPARYYQLPPLFQKQIGRIIGLNRGFINIPVNILARARRIAQIIRRENCQAVVACTGDLYDLPASYLASRLARVKFYPYIFDYYSQQWIDKKPRRIAERFEPIMMKRAAGIIVPNEFMRDELRRRYNVEATVIRNCCDLSLYESPAAESLADMDDAVSEGVGDDSVEVHEPEARIVYTGALSEAQIETFRSLMAALALLSRPGVKLHVYTAQSPTMLIERGIKGQIVFHRHQTVFSIPAVQQQADILFLPLAFNSPYPEVIKTSAPGKVADYLAARRPILVYAPPDSFIAWYFREYNCGLVVDENDPAKLAEGLARLLSDEDLRHRLGERAWERAHAEFSDRISRARFMRLLELE